MRNPRRSNSPASSTAGSDSRLTQCPPVSCFAPSPLFDPLRSASFSALPCTHKLCRAMALQDDSACAARDCFYHYHYGDDTDTLGFMGSETFTFGSTKKVSIPSIGFGCGLYNAGDIQNSSGVIGFGRGPISLISQLGVGTFSYCFTDFLDDDPKTSPLFFGTLARLTGPHIRTTRLIRLAQSMQPYSSYYHVSLKAITVGEGVSSPSSEDIPIQPPPKPASSEVVQHISVPSPPSLAVLKGKSPMVAPEGKSRFPPQSFMQEKSLRWLMLSTKELGSRLPSLLGSSFNLLSIRHLMQSSLLLF
ncbi:uncharacterized protein A4U43_C02F18640 [Asparagus officinalis]|uniref:Xylanase inhibitor N-terminal domain-containing protein n=1 Tax=Asparagus officinalis TaxID=4686 RepID=A0A5P1FJD4_ASPOF|nr:uncharacterized protein A4U43_C02F18640 [Asparagus officinalis]